MAGPAGVKVAPFKAQNMSLNSFVTADGAEIGRAQAMQAAAAGSSRRRDEPVLLKPGGAAQPGGRARPAGRGGRALSYRGLKPQLLAVVLDSSRFARRFDAVICEGAGSPAEINLRGRPRQHGPGPRAGLPVLVAGDIDRGGVFAAMYGTLALLAARIRR